MQTLEEIAEWTGAVAKVQFACVSVARWWCGGVSRRPPTGAPAHASSFCCPAPSFWMIVFNDSEGSLRVLGRCPFAFKSRHIREFPPRASGSAGFVHHHLLLIAPLPFECKQWDPHTPPSWPRDVCGKTSVGANRAGRRVTPRRGDQRIKKKSIYMCAALRETQSKNKWFFFFISGI